MKSKMMASRQYASNQFGMSNGDPGKRQARREARQTRRGGGGSDDAVQVCSKDNPGGCGWASSAGGPNNAQNTNVDRSDFFKSKIKSSRKLNARQAKKQAEKNEKIRASAPARPMTAMEKKKFVGPPTPDYVTKKSSTPAPAPKKTLGQRIKAAVTGPRTVKKMKV